ncbi:hypothetical protein KAU11_10640 [Candidatus Babeliales bacterium]|nr:hypothetical protein [Candidatus Babeliales bacterium]
MLLFLNLIANPFGRVEKVKITKSTEEIPNIDKEKEITTISKDTSQNSELFEIFVEVITLHEGFKSKPYHTGVDTDGMTIGYGHLIKEGEHFTEITEPQARQLLRKDFKRSIEYVKKYSPSISLLEHKLLPISHFVYAKGIGNYNRSKLKKRVDSAQTIDKQIKRWSTIVVKGIRKQHPWMLRNREFEALVYNGANPTVEIKKYREYVRINYGIKTRK